MEFIKDPYAHAKASYVAHTNSVTITVSHEYSRSASMGMTPEDARAFAQEIINAADLASK